MIRQYQVYRRIGKRCGILGRQPIEGVLRAALVVLHSAHLTTTAVTISAYMNLVKDVLMVTAFEMECVSVGMQTLETLSQTWTR